MAYFQFLGTGPSTPITEGTGRNLRLRSSALLQHISSYILIDATHDFEQQAEHAMSVTACVLTNASRDAAGGLGTLDRWLPAPAQLFATPELWALVAEQYGPFTRLRHVPIEVGRSTPCGDLELAAFALETSGGMDPSPCYGYRFDTGKRKIAYASDLKHIPEASLPYFSGNDLLVVDGAGWDKDLPTHRGALNHLHDYVAWRNERIIFTDIGRSAPPHSQASAQVRKMSHRAEVAFDFLKIPLGR
jgi:phosphoribosyl 1,2-cyclic phosphodiesterase